MNHTRRMHARIHAELDELVKIGILNADQAFRLKERYPVTAWNFVALVRAFTVLGAATAVAGMVILAGQHIDWKLVAEFLMRISRYIDWWLASEAGLAFVGIALLAFGYWLRDHKNMPATGEAAELVGGMALQGLTVVLAIHYSTGSKNWPALVGADTLMLVVLAYLLASRLVLWYACINFFFWFGAQTGYLSGWGCYWLGMTYPLRFLGAGVVTLGLSWLHAMIIRGRWALFSRVYAHFGMLVLNLALWFLALFGYYENYDVRWNDTQIERIVYSLLWAATSGVSLIAGARFGIRLLRGYGLTFLIVNLYTFYFQFVVANTSGAWFLHLLLAGGSLVWLGVFLERRLKRDKTQDYQENAEHDGQKSTVNKMDHL